MHMHTARASLAGMSTRWNMETFFRLRPQLHAWFDQAEAIFLPDAPAGLQAAVRSLAVAPVVAEVLAIDWGEASPARGFYRTWDPLTIDQVDTVLQDVLSFADLHQHLMWVCFDSPAAMEAVGGE